MLMNRDSHSGILTSFAFECIDTQEQIMCSELANCLVQAELDDFKFFGKPKLGLDAVGGTAAAKLADALVEVLDAFF